MNKKVLIVEDDQLLAYLLETYMVKFGLDIVGNVDNGKDAVLLAEQFNPDYILMDVRIEGDMDGIETATVINKINNAKIIYVSGNSDEYSISRSKKTNMLAFLVKPIKESDLNMYLN